MKKTFVIIFLLFSGLIKAQQSSLKGDIVDEKSSPVPFATVAILLPADSTLSSFGITGGDGHFEIKNIKAGKYILQAAYLGFQTVYRAIEMPLQTGEDIGTLVMKQKSVSLKEVDVSSERIPLLIKKDTIEYDAGSYKTKPDAAVEDLLKKLPGVEVDRAGNIKAQGENVKNVLVDGKEFFSSDPQVATKNLPADAIKKVQVYDKKSDEADLTGIDDGSRSKTINLLLNDDKKSAWLGDMLAGSGTDAHYQSSAKAYRFTKKSQFAVLGMLNNINQFGFSFRDYIDFNGGIGSMMNGDGNIHMTLNDDNSLPINFGQQVTGLITSGAGGLNYTYEKRKDNRFNISYLGNGADKNLQQNTHTQNFTTGNSFVQDEQLDETASNRAHRFNFGWRNKIDSTQHIIVNGNAGITTNNIADHAFSESLFGDSLQNNLYRATGNTGNRVEAAARGSYLKKGNNLVKLFKVTGDVSGYHSLKKNQWDNLAHYFSINELFTDQQFQNNNNDEIRYSVTSLVTLKTGTQWYVVPEIRAGMSNETLERKQGANLLTDELIDSLSPSFKSMYQWMRPAVSFRRSIEKSQFNFTAMIEAGKMSNSLNNDHPVNKNIIYFTPRLSWDYEYQTSHRLRAYYESSINIPGAGQLLNVTDNSNPLELTSGNRNLKPEYIHDLQLNWIVFDQFSFTSVFAGLNGTFTKDKINWARTIGSNFGQSLTLINVPEDYKAQANVDFSTPVRKFGFNIHVNPSETWNRTIAPVNGTENINTNYSHKFSLSFDNRKKEKWDANIGGSIQYTIAHYSLDPSLNTRYFNTSYFSELTLTPNDRWHFSVSADVTQYNAAGFNERITIPLLKMAASYYFLKANRGVLTLDAFDLLNKNTGLQRVSELNYLQQKQSNIIGRYVMLTFKYRLNKFDDKGGVKINVNGK